MITFNCCCGKTILVPEDQAGNIVKCPECGREHKAGKVSDMSADRNCGETVLPGKFIVMFGDWLTGPGLFVTLVLLFCVLIVMLGVSISGRSSGLSLSLFLLYAINAVILAIIIKYFISLLKCQHIIINLLTKQNNDSDDAR